MEEYHPDSVRSNENFPYPIPEKLAKRYEAEGFGDLWKRNRPSWFAEQYLDLETGKPTWDLPFFFAMTDFWLESTTHLLKLLQNEICRRDHKEAEALMLAVSRAFDDFRVFYNFTVEAGKYDPMMREEILGEAPVSPDNRPLKTVSE